MRTFSIIIPSYQQARFLAQNLQSLANQAGSVPLEIIIQDGGSTDGSVEIIRSFAAYPWKNYLWESKPDGGQASAINNGLRKATGDIIGYLNSDDYLLDDALKPVEKAFEDNPEKLVLYGNAIHTDENGELIGNYPTELWSFHRLMETCFICQPACFWKRELHDKIGYFNPDLHYALDYEFWLRAAKHGDFLHIPDFLAASRCHSSAKRFAHELEMREEPLKIVLQHNAGKAPVTWLTSIARAKASLHLHANPSSWMSATQFCLTYWKEIFSRLGMIDSAYGGLTLKKLIPPLNNARQNLRDPFYNLR